MRGKFQKLINVNKKHGTFKVDYEELKKYLKYEDVFFSTTIAPVLKKENIDCSFEGKYIIFRRKD